MVQSTDEEKAFSPSTGGVVHNSSTEDSEVHQENADVPILITLLGISILYKLLHA